MQNNDSHIIDRDDIIIGICKEMLAGNPFVIYLNGEGPCATSLGLYALLDKLCQRLNYDGSKISIKTCNLLEKHPVYGIVVEPQMVYLESARKFCQSQSMVQKDFDINFKHFGHFIGHGNIHRLHIASCLQKNFEDKSLSSYHYKMGEEYHKIFVGLEDMMFLSYHEEEIDQALHFLKSCPRVLDVIDQYPILNPTTFNITKIYHKFFVEIASMTYFSGNTFYIDEKIWRPIIMRTPFMVQGPQYFLINLRKLGFRTFDQWWDEGYSEDPGRCQVDGIIENIKKLSNYSQHDLYEMYQEMQGILEHNQSLLMSLSKEDFLSICNT